MRSGTININSFHSVKSFLAGEIQARKTRTDELDAIKRNVSGVMGKSNNSNKGKKNKKSFGPILNAFVDGRRVEGRSYSKDEWKKLSQPQRNKIKELLKQRKNNRSNDHGISAVTPESFRDDLVTLGDAIIAGVQRASTASIDAPDDASALTTASKRKAEAGSVGNIFGKRRKATSGHSNE